jgi:hypothetical protein
LFCTGNRKCNWYAGMITVNSKLDSASNDIYFLWNKSVETDMPLCYECWLTNTPLWRGEWCYYWVVSPSY